MALDSALTRASSCSSVCVICRRPLKHPSACPLGECRIDSRVLGGGSHSSRQKESGLNRPRGEWLRVSTWFINFNSSTLSHTYHMTCTSSRYSVLSKDRYLIWCSTRVIGTRMGTSAITSSNTAYKLTLPQLWASGERASEYTTLGKGPLVTPSDIGTTSPMSSVRRPASRQS